MIIRIISVSYTHLDVYKRQVQTLNHLDGDHISSGHLYLVRLLDKSLEQRNDIVIKMAERGIASVSYTHLLRLD